MSVYDMSGKVIADLGGITDISNFRNIAYLKLLYTQANGTVQGACTDGTYIYYTFSSSSTVIKYNILTKEVTSKSYASGLLGHANDMTYNPNTGHIYVTVMDDAGTIVEIDAETLEYVESHILTDGDGNVIETHGIAYDRSNNRFITADVNSKGKNYSIFTSDFVYVKTIITTRTESYTLQGIETDGEYIYRMLWDNTNARNFIYVWGFDAKLIKIIELPDANEVETTMYDWNGNWYASFNTSSGGGFIYYMAINKSLGIEQTIKLNEIIDVYK